MRYLRVSFEDVIRHPHLKTLVKQHDGEVIVDAAMFDWVAVPETHSNIDTIVLMLNQVTWIDSNSLPYTTSISIREFIGNI